VSDNVLVISKAVLAELQQHRDLVRDALDGFRDGDTDAIEAALHNLDDRIRTLIADAHVLGV
jgi:hypothetical protein